MLKFIITLVCYKSLYTKCKKTVDTKNKLKCSTDFFQHLNYIMICNLFGESCKYSYATKYEK